jgi:hypothetical protein
VNVQAPQEPTEGMLWRAWTALGAPPHLGLDDLSRIYKAVLDARLGEEQAPADPRTPTLEQIRRSGLLGGIIGYSISEEVCPACQKYFLIHTMNGTDCVCGHTETF